MYGQEFKWGKPETYCLCKINSTELQAIRGKVTAP